MTVPILDLARFSYSLGPLGRYFERIEALFVWIATCELTLQENEQNGNQESTELKDGSRTHLRLRSTVISSVRIRAQRSGAGSA